MLLIQICEYFSDEEDSGGGVCHTIPSIRREREHHATAIIQRREDMEFTYTKLTAFK
jgi:hypothetical protein